MSAFFNEMENMSQLIRSSAPHFVSVRPAARDFGSIPKHSLTAHSISSACFISRQLSISTLGKAERLNPLADRAFFQRDFKHLAHSFQNEKVSKEGKFLRENKTGCADRRKIRRKRLSFLKNISIARSSDLEHGRINCIVGPILETIGDQFKRPASKIVHSISCRTEDHAQRRLQLFYYLLVAYHEERCHIVIDKTELQHGTSSCSFCSAAHSSILPNISDDFFFNLAITIMDMIQLNGDLDEEIKSKLIHLGASATSIDKLRKWKLSNWDWKQLFREIGIKGRLQLISDTSHFYQNMNSTVELPKIVNKIDCLIENQMRVQALKILNEASIGNILPYDGLLLFVKELRSFLHSYSKSARGSIDRLRLHHGLENERCSLVKTAHLEAVMQQINTLQDSIQVVDWQLKGSYPLSEELLAGQFKDGKLHFSGREDLIKKKNEIIKK